MIKLLWLRIKRYFIAREIDMIDAQIWHAHHARAHDLMLLADINQRIASAEINLGRMTSY